MRPPAAIAKRDQHSAMTDPRPVHVVGDSKSNSKISKFFLLYAERQLAGGMMRARGSAERCRASSRGMMPEVSLVSPQVDDGGQFPHGPDVQLGRGDPLRDPQSRFSV